MSLASQLYKSIRALPGGLAGGYIDLSRAELVRMLTMDEQPIEVLNHLVGVSDDLFQGDNVTLIESLFREFRGSTDDGHTFQEIIIITMDVLLLFLRCRSNRDHVVTFACEGESNPVLALANARNELRKLEASYKLDKLQRK